MKCYHCGENEAELRFFVNYMGQSGEVHLCTECVEKFKAYTSAMFQEMAAGPAAVWAGSGLSREPVEVRAIGEDTFPLDAGVEIRRRRRLGELKAALGKAVELEDYETAASLRDQIIESEKDVYIYDT